MVNLKRLFLLFFICALSSVSQLKAEGVLRNRRDELIKIVSDIKSSKDDSYKEIRSEEILRKSSEIDWNSGDLDLVLLLESLLSDRVDSVRMFSALSLTWTGRMAIRSLSALKKAEKIPDNLNLGSEVLRPSTGVSASSMVSQVIKTIESY
jgi:hypothetical protein